VARGHFESARPELGVHVVVGDDREAAPDQGQEAMTADQRLIAPIGRMDGDRGVREHRLRAHRRDGQDLVRALHRIVDRVQGVLNLAILDL
jgi:hypothetical protein